MLGSEADYHSVQGLLDVYAKKSALMGPIGAGQLTKMVNQICIAGILQGLAEGCTLPKAQVLMGLRWSMSFLRCGSVLADE